MALGGRLLSAHSPLVLSEVCMVLGTPRTAVAQSTRSSLLPVASTLCILCSLPLLAVIHSHYPPTSHSLSLVPCRRLRSHWSDELSPHPKATQEFPSSTAPLPFSLLPALPFNSSSAEDWVGNSIDSPL